MYLGHCRRFWTLRDEKSSECRLLRRGLDRRGFEHPSYLATLRTSWKVERLHVSSHLRLAQPGRCRCSAHSDDDVGAGCIWKNNALVSWSIHKLQSIRFRHQGHGDHVEMKLSSPIMLL